MGKALIIAGSNGGTVANGSEFSLGGYGTITSTEVQSQVSCTEAATFSTLRGSVVTGNSGTATFRFRDAGANGSEVFQITGTGIGEDATNTDSLTAGDLFNIAYTDTGTDSGVAWVTANVEFGSGHGSFHIAADYGGRVHDVQSATRFISINGNMPIDGQATEDNVEWLVRGYDSFEALQVYVSANARANDSIFRNRINGGDGSAVITYGSGATGLITDTVLGDAITAGQTVNASLTLDTGVQGLTVHFIGATLKSSASKSEVASCFQVGVARTASATAHYIPIGGRMPAMGTFSDAQARIKVGFAAVVSNLRCYLSANTYTGDGTLKLYQNGSAVLTTTITASGGAAWYENTSDTITIDADDELSFEFDEGTSGSITIHSVGITFAPVEAGGGTILPQMMQHGLFLGMRT